MFRGQACRLGQLWKRELFEVKKRFYLTFHADKHNAVLITSYPFYAYHTKCNVNLPLYLHS